MPSIDKGYEYDVFISYRQNDNRSGWVSEFVAGLEEELASVIKYPVSVYFDSNPRDALLETHHVDKSLERKLKCLIFIPVLSQTYCDPQSFAWRDEFLAFRDLAESDPFKLAVRLINGNFASRILPVRIHDLDPGDLELFEKESRGALRPVDFIFRAPGVNRPLRSKDDDVKEIHHALFYRDQINKLANAIRDMLAAIRAPSSEPGNIPVIGPSKAVLTADEPVPHELTRKASRKILMIATLSAIVLGIGMFSLPTKSPLEFPLTRKISFLSLFLSIGLLSYFLVGHAAIQSKGRKLILAITILSLSAIFIHFVFTDDIAITLLLIFSPVLYYIVSQK